MDALTEDNIIKDGKELHPDIDIFQVSIAYIQHILHPLAGHVDRLQTVDKIMDWINYDFTKEIGKHAIGEVNKALSKDKQLEDIKRTVINYLADEIIELGGYKTKNRGSNIILPWDVQEAIGDDVGELSTMFNINSTDDMLPVTVTVDGKQFIHNLNREFTVGLLLYSYVSGINFYITMYGKVFSTYFYLEIKLRDGLIPEDYEKYKDINTMSGYVYLYTSVYKYTIRINGLEYAFSKPDFMQGFITGAQWSNDDHHRYWSDLISYDNDGNETQITF